MEKSRLILLFNTFTKKEIRDLRKWLHSPAHNQRQDVILLFEHLSKNQTDDVESSDAKTAAFQAIFPSESFDDARLRQVMHFFFKAIEEFLIYQELRADEVRSLTALARVYRKRKLDKLFHTAIQSAQEANLAYPFRNENFQRNEFLIQLEELAFTEGKRRTVKMNLQEVVNALEVTFLADKLRYSCLMLAHQSVYKTDYDLGLLELVLRYVEERQLLHIPAIAVYYYGYRTNTEKQETHFFQNLKEQVLLHENLFPAGELRDIYLMTINYLISRMNAGDTSISPELFEFYKKGLERGVLFENEVLSRFTFRNIVSLGLKLGEFAWVEQFILSYRSKLEPQHQESIGHFSMANLAFEKKDYATAMRQLMQVEYDDLLMNLNAKRMLIKMFYEEEEIDSLESLLDSLRTYLQRKKVMGYHKSNITNFIRLTKRLLKVNPYEKKMLEDVRRDILDSTPMSGTDREWLLQRLDKI
jgi:hypothetical protein